MCSDYDFIAFASGFAITLVAVSVACLVLTRHLRHRGIEWRNGAWRRKDD